MPNAQGTRLILTDFGMSNQDDMDHTINYKIINDTDAAGIITLCQKLKKIKVLLKYIK